ncbi:lysophospholipid acyltransferase family protein [Jeotgalibacillus aurantiacus]|uniref:lysophospholipid acyltransferase family protein n=1 Tax=Jeotgalibacillus aurantiacus TaxID=2763266 RepID=UPI001D0A2ED4|nr:lysophospholipid acyltransferase family protein [Jeotgalibacillus aurantiacus]
MKPVKSKRTERVLSSFLTYQFKKHFYRVYIQDQRTKSAPGGKQYLINHSSWWDGLLVFYLNQKVVKEDSYAMMSRKGVEEFPFFSKIGAFAVDPSSPKSLIKQLKLAKDLLNDQKSIWIFPQGKEEHIEKRPMTFMSGPAYLVEHADEHDIIPVSAYYTFRHDQRPELFILIGKEISSTVFDGMSRAQINESLKTECESQLDQIRMDLIEEQITGYSLFLKGFPTASEWLQFFKRLSPDKKEKS